MYESVAKLPCGEVTVAKLPCGEVTGNRIKSMAEELKLRVHFANVLSLGDADILGNSPCSTSYYAIIYISNI